MRECYGFYEFRCNDPVSTRCGLGEFCVPNKQRFAAVTPANFILGGLGLWVENP